MLFQGIEEEIDDRAPVIENFLKVSQALVQNAQPDDREDLSTEIEHVNEALNSIVIRTADRRRILETAEPLAKDYHENLLMLAEVIDEVENKLKSQRAFGAEPQKVNEEIEDIKVRIVRFFLRVLCRYSSKETFSRFFFFCTMNKACLLFPK